MMVYYVGATGSEVKELGNVPVSAVVVSFLPA